MFMIVKVGLQTRFVSFIPSPAAIPLANTVFPAPSSPSRKTTSLPLKERASFRARPRVPLSDLVTVVMDSTAALGVLLEPFQGLGEVADDVAGHERFLAQCFRRQVAAQPVDVDAG